MRDPMKKHQYVKVKCDCTHRATNFVCKYCDAMEHGSYDEIRNLDVYRALCTGADAPLSSPVEMFKAKMGGGFDCLAPDFDSWEKKE
jgi:hypothetical protein